MRLLVVEPSMLGICYSINLELAVNGARVAFSSPWNVSIATHSVVLRLLDMTGGKLPGRWGDFESPESSAFHELVWFNRSGRRTAK